MSSEVDMAARSDDAPDATGQHALDARLTRLSTLVERLERTLADRDAALRRALAERDAETAKRREAVQALDDAIEDLKQMAQE